MTYLLTGATGLIGRRLTKTLLDSGTAVHYLGRRRDAQMDSRAAFQPWPQPESEVAPLDSVPRTDAIIHLAGEPVAQRWSAEAKKEIADSRIIGTRNLVTGIGRTAHRPRVLVSASAVGYYGNRGDEILTEDSAAGSGFLAEVCQGWESEARKAEEHGVRVVVVRFGIVLARDGGALSKMLPAFRAGVAGRLGNGKQWISWIHKDDLVRLLRWAAETEDSGRTLNGVAPEPVTNAAFTKSLAGVLNRPAILPVPAFALKLILGEMSSALLQSTRVVPDVAPRLGFEFRYAKLDSALTAALSSSGPADSL